MYVYFVCSVPWSLQSGNLYLNLCPSYNFIVVIVSLEVSQSLERLLKTYKYVCVNVFGKQFCVFMFKPFGVGTLQTISLFVSANKHNNTLNYL